MTAAVIVFDLDGTLLPGTSVSAYLAGRMGHARELDELERRYRGGEIDNAAIAAMSAPWFAGVRPAEVAGLLRDAPWIPGIAETVAELRDRRALPLLATITWRFAADLVGGLFGFTAVSGTVMGMHEGVLTGEIERLCDEYGKRDLVRSWCAEHHVPMSRVAAVGDSRSDLPLFAVAGFSLALNPTPDARAGADRAVDTEDLRDVLGHLPLATA
jgi:phosphoserine phosphatase